MPVARGTHGLIRLTGGLLPVGAVSGGGIGTTYAIAYTTSLSPLSGNMGVAATMTFTPTAGSWPVGVVITPSKTSLTGTFSPTTISPSGTGAVTCTFTPSAASVGTLNSSTSPTMTNTTGGRTYTATASSGTTFMLDGLTSTVAGVYALRRTRTAWAGASVRVRRSSDNLEADIGFDGVGNLLLTGTGSLLAHCGSGDGFVTKAYDQSGLGQDAVQATTSKQPKIVAAGVVVILPNSTAMPAMLFIQSAQTSLVCPSFALTGSSYAATAVCAPTSNDASYARLLSFNGATNDYDNTSSVIFMLAEGGSLAGYQNGAAKSIQSYSGTTPLQVASVWTGATNVLSLNGNSGSSVGGGGTLASPGRLGIGTAPGSTTTTDFWDGYVSEVIIIDGALSDQGTLYTNESTYYGTPGPPPVINDTFAPGIYYPSTVYYNNTTSANIFLASGFARLETNGPQTWTLGGPDAAYFRLEGVNGSFLNGDPAYGSSKSSFSITINVTDGTTTKSKNVTVLVGNYLLSGGNFILDTSPTNYYGSYLVVGTYPNARQMPGGIQTAWAGSGPFTFTDPNGFVLWDQTGGYSIFWPGTHDPMSSHFGSYTGATFSGASAGTQQFPYWLAQEQPAYVAFTPTGAAVYDYLDPGDLIGHVGAYSDAGVTTITLLSSDGTVAMGNSGNLVVKAGQALVAGSKTLTVRVTSGSGKVTDTVVPYTVVAGTRVTPSNMTLSVPSTLDNYVFAQTIGTPSISGTVPSGGVWTLSNPDDCMTIYQGTGTAAEQIPNNLFAINASTGAVAGATGKQLPARTHSITLTYTAGSTRCRQTFSVPVAWKVGPTIYVGQGMASAHGSSGYEHWSSVVALLQTQDIGSMAGATIRIVANSSANYYAADGTNETINTNALLRFGINGPVKIVADSATGARPRMGGTVGSVSGGCGSDGEAYFNIRDGDVLIDGIELSYVQGPGSPDTDNTQGISGIRKNADTYGDITLQNMFIHDCNNDFESGNGPYWTTVTNSVLANAGTAYVSSGATHAIYSGACTKLVFTGNLTFGVVNGHHIKSRAKSGTITGNRLIDGQRGSCSNLIDIPEAGNYTISGNFIQKGPNPQNPCAIQYGEEGYTDFNGNPNRINQLAISSNTIVITTPPGNHFGSVAISVAGCVSNLDGSLTAATLTGNSYYLAGGATQSEVSIYGTATPTITETGAVTLTSMPAIDVSDPSTHTAYTRPGWFNDVFDNAETYTNFDHVQQDPGTEDLRVSHTAVAGTVLATIRSYGSPLFYNDSPTDSRINPFTSGTVFSITQDPMYGGNTPWAPVGRYAINSSTGVLTVAGTLPATGTTDFIKVRATAPGGTLCDYRYAVSVI